MYCYFSIHTGNIDRLTQLLLVNAIYMHSSWQNAFSAAKRQIFSSNRNSEKMVPTLSEVQVYYAGQNDTLGAKYVHLQFAVSTIF